MAARYVSASAGRSLRPLWIGMHRWAGLTLAFFIVMAGTTGALIAWERELDSRLNPELYAVQGSRVSRDERRSSLDLVEQVERDYPRLYVSYAPLDWEHGNTVIMRVKGRVDPLTGEMAELGFGEIFVNPVTGTLQGKRLRTAISANRTQWLPMIYRLHHSLHLPYGRWFMGGVAVLWTADCFVALWLSFPSMRSWHKSLRFRWRAGGRRLRFDLHRSSGVWAWVLLLSAASTAVTMNLEAEMVRPILRRISQLRATPSEFPQVPPRCAASVSRRDILRRSAQEAKRLSIQTSPGAVSFSITQGLYGIEFFDARHDPSGRGGTGFGPVHLYFDSCTGALQHVHRPGTGSMADIYYDLQFPLHSGRLLGTAGRVLVTLVGVMATLLCCTGILIWRRKVLRQKHRRHAPSLARRPLASSHETRLPTRQVISPNSMAAP